MKRAFPTAGDPAAAWRTAFPEQTGRRFDQFERDFAAGLLGDLPSVRPESGTVGGRFFFAAAGFQPMEPWSMEIRGPDGRRLRLPANNAGPRGVVHGSLRLPPNAPLGAWEVALIGDDGSRAEVRFSVHPMGEAPATGRATPARPLASATAALGTIADGSPGQQPDVDGSAKTDRGGWKPWRTVPHCNCTRATRATGGGPCPVLRPTRRHTKAGQALRLRSMAPTAMAEQTGPLARIRGTPAPRATIVWAGTGAGIRQRRGGGRGGGGRGDRRGGRA